QEVGSRLSPYRVKNAIVATAKPIGEPYGVGMVQADAAWQFLKQHRARAADDVTWDVEVDDTPRARGIYLREPEESAHVRFFSASARPVFPTSRAARLEHDAGGEHARAEAQAQFDFEQRMLLVTSESWVSAPDAVYVASKGCKFAVRVDATQLQAGRVHTATIDAYDAACVDRGPVFRVPVTVAKPLRVDASACANLGVLQFRPTELVRRFVAVPPGATRARICLHAANAAPAESASAFFYLHCMQLEPSTRFRRFSNRSRVDVGHKSYAAGGGGAEQKKAVDIDVIGGATLEVCLAQYWNQLGSHDLGVTVEFNGIVPSGTAGVVVDGGPLRAGVVVHGGNSVARLDFVAPVRPEQGISPSVSLTAARKALRPTESAVAPMGVERDVHLGTGSAMYKLELDYRLETTRDNTRVRLHMPAVDTQIYENWADNFALALFDANKRYLTSQISYTSNITIKRKGEYLVRVQIRHRSAADLDALKDMPLVAEITLDAPLKLATKFSLASLYTSTVAGASKFVGGFVPRGGRFPLFINTLDAAMPADAAPGDVLVGKLSLSTRTAKLDFEYVVPPKSQLKKEAEPSGSKKPESKPETKEDQDQRELAEAMRAVRIDWIKKARDDGVRTRLVAELLSGCTDEQRAEVLAAQLSALDATRTALPWSESAKLGSTAARQAVTVADTITELTRPLALTARLYEKAKTDEDKELKKKADLARTQLIGALTAKCRALAVLTHGPFPATASDTSAEFVELDDGEEDAAEKTLCEYERACAELRQWTDASSEDAAFVFATAPAYMARHQYARALQPVLAWLAKAPVKQGNAPERKAMAELRDLLLAKLQWTLWTDHFRAIAPIECPASYEPL
ncbi:hypothetical protein GGF43_002121, partial [Coemansia sp. RSA 2618]